MFSGNKRRDQMEIGMRHGDIEQAIKVLSRQVTKDGILKEARPRRAYEKPSVKRKRKQREAQRRRQKEERKRG